MIPRSMALLVLCGMSYGRRDPATEHTAFLSSRRSNCVFFAFPRWFGDGQAKPERYLMIRRSRVAWGVFHMLYGTTNPMTGQIEMMSYKPPKGHQKPGIRPVFEGQVVWGDAP